MLGGGGGCFKGGAKEEGQDGDLQSRACSLPNEETKTEPVVFKRVACVGSVKAVAFSECGRFLFAGIANVLRCFELGKEKESLVCETFFDAAKHILTLLESRSLVAALGVGQATVFALKTEVQCKAEKLEKQIRLMPVFSLWERCWWLNAKFVFLNATVLPSNELSADETNKVSVCKRAFLLLGNSDGKVELRRVSDGLRLCVFEAEGAGLLYSLALYVHPKAQTSSDTSGCTDTCLVCRRGLLSKARFLVAGGTVFTQVLIWGSSLEVDVCTRSSFSSNRFSLSLLARLDGHRGVVLSLRFAENGRFLLSASDDREVRVWTSPWEEASDKGCEECSSFEGPSNMKKVSLASSDEASVRALEKASREAPVALQGIAGRRPFLKEGQREGENLAEGTGGGERWKCRWALPTRCFSVLRGHRSRVWKAAFLDLRGALPPDVFCKVQTQMAALTYDEPRSSSASSSKLIQLAACFLFVVTAGEDSRICVWSLDGTCLSAFPAHEGRGIRSLDTAACASGEAAFFFTPNAASRWLAFASGGEDGGLKLWTKSSLPLLWKTLSRIMKTALCEARLHIVPREIGLRIARDQSTMTNSLASGPWEERPMPFTESECQGVLKTLVLKCQTSGGAGVPCGKVDTASDPCKGGSSRDFLRSVFLLPSGEEVIACSNFGHVFKARFSKEIKGGDQGDFEQLLLCASAVVTCASLVDDFLALGTADGRFKVYRHPALQGGFDALSHRIECPSAQVMPVFPACRVSSIFAFSLGPLSHATIAAGSSFECKFINEFCRALVEEDLFPLTRSSSSVTSSWTEIRSSLGHPFNFANKIDRGICPSVLTACCDHLGNIEILLVEVSALTSSDASVHDSSIFSLGRVQLPRASGIRSEAGGARETNRFVCAIALAGFRSTGGPAKTAVLSLLLLLGDEHGSLHAVKLQVAEGRPTSGAGEGETVGVKWKWSESLVSADLVVADAHPRRKVCVLVACGGFIFSCGADGRVLVLRVEVQSPRGEEKTGVSVERLQTLRFGLISAFVSLEPGSRALRRYWWIRGKCDFEAWLQMRTWSNSEVDKGGKENQLESVNKVVSASACGFSLAKMHLAIGVKGREIQVFDLGNSAVLLSLECGDAKRSFSVCADSGEVRAIAFSRGPEVCIFSQALSSAFYEWDRNAISGESTAEQSEHLGNSQNRRTPLLPPLHGGDIHDALFLGPFELCTCGEDNSVKVMHLEGPTFERRSATNFSKTQPVTRVDASLECLRRDSPPSLLRSVVLASSTTRHRASVLALKELPLWESVSASLWMPAKEMGKNVTPPRLVVSAGAAKTLNIFAVTPVKRKTTRDVQFPGPSIPPFQAQTPVSRFELRPVDLLCLEDRQTLDMSANARFTGVTGFLVATQGATTASEEEEFDTWIVTTVSTGEVLLIRASVRTCKSQKVTVSHAMAVHSSLQLPSAPLCCFLSQLHDTQLQARSNAVSKDGRLCEENEFASMGILIVGLSDGNIACVLLGLAKAASESLELKPSLKAIGLLRGHQRAVTSVCFGKLEKRSAQPRESIVNSEAASRQMFLLCSSGDDGAISVQVISLMRKRDQRDWSMRVISRVSLPNAHGASARCLSLRPPFLLSVGWDRWLQVWKIRQDVGKLRIDGLGGEIAPSKKAESACTERVSLLRVGEGCSLCGARQRRAGETFSFCNCRPPLSCFNKGRQNSVPSAEAVNARLLDARLERFFLARCGSHLQLLIEVRNQFFTLHGQNGRSTDKARHSEDKTTSPVKPDSENLFFCLERCAATKTSVFEASALASYTSVCTRTTADENRLRICCVGAGGGVDVFEVSGVKPQNSAPLSSAWTLHAL